jgi:precorrin-6B C5,15-methyltransferase / cobalt-precorrin-6B C5,C15-methyltransferase
MSPAVTVIGCDGRPFGPEAAQALAAASLIIGAPRHLEAAAIPPGAERVEIKHLDVALDTLDARSGHVAVLASGDPGFFGIVRALRARSIEPHVLPATSSVTLAFARLGLDWDDALVISAHGREPRGPKHALAAALAHPKAAILTAPRTATARDLGAELLAAGKKVYVAECLGTPQEQVIDLAAEPAREFAEPNILIALDQATLDQATLDQATPDQAAPGTPRWLAGHQGAPDGWALPEDAFEHRDSMITKAEVRALILARLGPAPGRVIWDVGAGAGSVAVECARFGAWVIAVEADQAQCDRIRRNATRHGVHLQLRQGRAPEALNGLPPADAVFVGGGDRAVLAAAVKTANPGRVVVTLAAIQRVGETSDLLTDLGYRPEGVQLQASRLASLPNGQFRLAAQNPVFVLWAQR